MEKILATKVITNSLAIMITDIDDERVTMRWSNDDKNHTLKLHYNKNGDAYFVYNGNRYYINDFMRTERW